MSDLITLWRPTGRLELDLVAASGWREWPPRLPEQPIFYPVLNRAYATRIAREWNAAHSGVGFVTRFDVRRDYLDRHSVQHAGSSEHVEYWIPADELDEFNTNIVGGIVSVAEYRGRVGDAEFETATRALGRSLPDAWRAYLQGPSWFRAGFLDGGTYVRLQDPAETVSANLAWGEATARHHGIAMIGSDGGSEYLALDLRDEATPVYLVTAASGGWGDAVVQAPDLGTFIARIEGGSFEFAR